MSIVLLLCSGGRQALTTTDLLDSTGWLTSATLTTGVWEYATQIPPDFSQLPDTPDWQDVKQSLSPAPEGQPPLLIDIGQAKRAANEGLTEEIDYSVVDNGADLVPEARGSHWTAGEIETVLMGYRTDKFKDKHPMSWKDFWNVDAFPGNRALHNWCVTTMEAALLADGVPANALYPLDIDRAFASLHPYANAGAD